MYDWSAAVKLHSEYQTLIAELNNEYKEKLKKVYPNVDDLFGTIYPTGCLMVYPTEHSEGAEFYHEDNNATFYSVKVGNYTVTEAIRKKADNNG